MDAVSLMSSCPLFAIELARHERSFNAVDGADLYTR
jgi:hypothetical protein